MSRSSTLTLPKELTRHCDQKMMSRLPHDWLWQGRTVKLVDGTTLSMPDTECNQAVYPQSLSQKNRGGFPICRLVGLMSLSCGAVIDIASAPTEGKKTGEQAKFRSLLHNLQRDDVLLGDAYYGSYFVLCELQKRGVDGVFEQHGGRKKICHFRRGQSLGKRDRIVKLTNPVRPKWMSEHEYVNTPKSLSIRELSTGGKTGIKIIPKNAATSSHSQSKYNDTRASAHG